MVTWNVFGYFDKFQLFIQKITRSIVILISFQLFCPLNVWKYNNNLNINWHKSFVGVNILNWYIKYVSIFIKFSKLIFQEKNASLKSFLILK
jgi:hypothetical protein